MEFNAAKYHVIFVSKRTGYASIIWDCDLQKDLDRMEREKGKATRRVTASYNMRTFVTRLLKDLLWDPFHEIASTIVFSTYVQSKNDHVALPAESFDLIYFSSHKRVNKNKQKLFKPKTNITEPRKYFVHIIVPNWNSRG